MARWVPHGPRAVGVLASREVCTRDEHEGTSTRDEHEGRARGTSNPTNPNRNAEGIRFRAFGVPYCPPAACAHPGLLEAREPHLLPKI